MANQPLFPPLKNIALALVFAVILGPVGLLYSSFWGGFFMIFLALIIFTSKQMLLLFLTWVTCCIWSVGAAETYNRKTIKAVNTQLPLSG
jgi:hypothetical protein